LEAVDKNTCWFSGSEGMVGFTEDGGKTWKLDSIVYEGIKPEFRSITVTDSAVFVLSVSSPVLLFKTADKMKKEREPPLLFGLKRNYE